MSDAINHLGQGGYGPYVDEIDGRLIYSLPVDVSFVSASFDFEITWRDLECLKSHPDRAIVLGEVMFNLLQSRFGPARPAEGPWPIKTTEAEFRTIADIALYGSDDDVKRFLPFRKDAPRAYSWPRQDT